MVKRIPMKASNIQIDIKDKKKSQKDTHIGDSRLYELEYEVSIPDNDLSRTGYRIGKAKGYLEATSHDRDMKNPAFKAAFEAGKQKGFSFGKRDNLRSFHRDSSGSEDDSLVEELFGDESDGDRIISLDIRRERDDDGVTDDSDFEPPRGLGANSRPGVRRSPRKGGIGGDHNKDEGEDGQGSTRQRGTRTTGNRDQGRQKTRCERSENKDKEDEDSDEDEEMTDPPDHDDDDEDVSSEGVPEAEESEGHRDEVIFLHAVRVNGNNFGGGLRIEQNGKVFELKNDKKVKRTPSEYKKTWEIDGNTGKFVLEYEGGLQKEHAMSFRKGSRVLQYSAKGESMVLRFQNCGISKHHTNDGKYTPIVNFFVPSYSYFKKFGTSESFREHWPTEDMARHNDKYLKTFIGRLKAIVGVKFQVHNQEYDNIIKAEKANGIGDNQQPRGESQPKRKSLRNSAIPEDDIASEQDNESEAEDEGETLFIVKQRTQNEDSNTRRKAKTPKGKQHARPQTADAGKTASPSTATSSENTLPASNSKSRRGRKSIQDLDDDELLDSGRETNSDDDYNPGPSKGTAEIGKQTSVPKNTRSTRKRA